MSLSPGDRLEFAIWLDGSETQDMLDGFKTVDVPEVFRRWAEQEGVLIGAPELSIKQPGEERVPPVPQWLEQRAMSSRRSVTLRIGEGPALTYTCPALLLAEAMVVGLKPVFATRSFIGDLTQADLARLRAVTKMAWTQQHGDEGPLTDSECDAIIERFGPDAAYRAVLDQLETGKAN